MARGCTLVGRRAESARKPTHEKIHQEAQGEPFVSLVAPHRKDRPPRFGEADRRVGRWPTIGILEPTGRAGFVLDPGDVSLSIGDGAGGQVGREGALFGGNADGNWIGADPRLDSARRGHTFEDTVVIDGHQAGESCVGRPFDPLSQSTDVTTVPERARCDALLSGLRHKSIQKLVALHLAESELCVGGE